MGIFDFMKKNVIQEAKDPNEILNFNRAPSDSGNWLFNKVSVENQPLSYSNMHLFDDIFMCINILSDDVAKLPIKVYQKTGNKIKEDADHEVSELLKKNPNRHMTPYVWKKLIMADLGIYGNHISYIRYDKTGKITELVPLDFPSVEMYLYTNGEMVYSVKNQEGKDIKILEEDVLHFKTFSRDGLVGISPLDVLRPRAESNAIATSYNNEMLRNGATPSGVLKVNGALAAEDRQKVKDEWKKANGDGSVAVIPSGMDYQSIGFSQKDLEFIESQRYNQEKIAGIYKIPLHKLNRLERSTYSNIEHQSLEYVKNTLQPYVVMIEEEIKRKLFLKDEKDYYIKFNLESELRGDSKTKAEVHEYDLRNGIKTLNELRAEEELSPYENGLGDKPLMTLNYTFLEDLITYQMSKYATAVKNVNEKGGEDNGVGETDSPDGNKQE